jgi:pilus assembly protein CpaB
MTIGPRPVQLVLLGASVCALLATVFAYFHLSQRKRELDNPMTVLVATRDLPPGIVVRPEMVSASRRPLKKAHRTALRDTAEVVGRVTMRTVAAGEVFTPKMIAPPGPALGPSYVLARGMRAVTVSVEAVSNLLRPGDRVDVLAIFDNLREKRVRVVLQDVQVLAVGTQTERELRSKDGLPRMSLASRDGHWPVTLAVTIPQAQRLVLAEETGKLRLIMRPAVGGDTVHTREISETAINGLRPGRHGGG